MQNQPKPFPSFLYLSSRFLRYFLDIFTLPIHEGTAQEVRRKNP